MKDIFTKDWIITNSIEICNQYEKGILTLRGLHYQLVGRGMTNDIQHYKRVVGAMIDARWDDKITFDQFSDLDREMVGDTEYRETVVESEIENACDQVEAWMTSYHKNRWENQPYYPEIFIEKKALQGVFQKMCSKWSIALGACKGYPSLTFLHDTYKRFDNAVYQDKNPIILYFGDYDPSGEDIPRSIQANLLRFGVDVEVRRIALMEEQVVEWNLPPAPTKEYKIGKRKNGTTGYIGDSRDKEWSGLGQVELDAVKPEQLMKLCEDAIKDIFNETLHKELIEQEGNERIKYITELKDFVNNLKD